MAIQDDIRNYFISERFSGQTPSGFDDDYDLIDSGTIDSVFMVGLITYIERQFKIEFGMNDIVPKYFKSVNALTAFVSNRERGGDAR